MDPGTDPDSPQEPPKDKLEEFLTELKGVYDYEVSEYRRCLNVVAKDLRHVLAQESIRHLPIASRVKSWDSINGTAHRRQKDRLAAQVIQRKMTEQNENWEQHFERYKMSKTELGYFRNRDELEHVFHDMLGARIVLYFPSDTKKVISLLEDAGYENVKERKRMGGLADVKRLRRLHAKWLDASASKAPADDLDLDGLEPQFSGYGAIHLAMKLPERLQPRDLRPEAKEIWERRVVEIQVGTVIMHAWAEVEHDITYKTHGREVTQDEKGLLDMLNGLALASEVGLRRFRSPPSSPSPPAESEEELRSWLHQLYITQKRSTPAEWVDLDQLWDFLVQRRMNCRDAFQPLAEAAWSILLESERKEGFELDHVLPYIIQHKLVPDRVIKEGRSCSQHAKDLSRVVIPSEVQLPPPAGNNMNQGSGDSSNGGSGGSGGTAAPGGGTTPSTVSEVVLQAQEASGEGRYYRVLADGVEVHEYSRFWLYTGYPNYHLLTILHRLGIRTSWASSNDGNGASKGTAIPRGSTTPSAVSEVVLQAQEASGEGRYYRVLADGVEVHEYSRFWLYNGYPNSHLLTILQRLGVRTREI